MKKVKTGFLALLAVAALLFAGATMVQAAEDPDGVGDVLIYPLYLANGTAFTEFTLVNTANVAQSVHIQIRSQGNSQDQLDFCIELTENDVYKAKISSDGAGGAILETLNNVDYTDSAGDPIPGWHKAPDTAGLIEADTSDCSYSTQKGYIVAYAVDDCDSSDTLADNATIMGNTRIIETATSKIMALNAVAVEGNETAHPDPFTDAQSKLNKDELYMIWEFEKAAAVLTVPTIGTANATNDELCDSLVGPDEDGVLSNDLCGCGFAKLTNDFETMYDLDENPFSKLSPHYYPANEVSIVNFTNAGTNTDSTNFYINGSAKYWGLNFTGDTLEEGWTRWVIPTQDEGGNSMAALHNVVCTYFISTNNSLAWMPCQYLEGTP
ncbi:MAG: hypothetical protein DRH43_05310 [Deltaproteobacteria bacterium]|nr:MAG: hypothetical protein DRH43_05310 [Deltaproteobacteria bacterium]